MAGISINYAYSTDALLALLAKPLYNLPMSWGFQLLFTLSSQVIGIALAGLFRRFLVSAVTHSFLKSRLTCVAGVACRDYLAQSGMFGFMKLPD
jgi:hypothetical protein